MSKSLVTILLQAAEKDIIGIWQASLFFLHMVKMTVSCGSRRVPYDDFVLLGFVSGSRFMMPCVITAVRYAIKYRSRWLRKYVSFCGLCQCVTLYTVTSPTIKTANVPGLKIRLDPRKHNATHPNWGNFSRRERIKWCSEHIVKLKWPTTAARVWTIRVGNELGLNVYCVTHQHVQVLKHTTE